MTMSSEELQIEAVERYNTTQIGKTVNWRFFSYFLLTYNYATSRLAKRKFMNSNLEI